MHSKAGSQITPFILTYNEEPNIARALKSLLWAERVIVLDSGSTDRTEAIARDFPNVDWHVRAFDSFKAQTEYAVFNTGISTDYVLALDADMAVSRRFVAELESAFLPQHFSGGAISFEYQIAGRSLTSSVCPAQLRLFKKSEVQVIQEGHGHTFAVSGMTYRFNTRLIHDDRKSLERWIASQLSYSAIESNRLSAGESSRLQDRLRKFGVMPVIAGAVAYLRAGGPLRGAAAARYAYERAVYECLLAIRLMNKRLEEKDSSSEE